MKLTVQSNVPLIVMYKPFVNENGIEYHDPPTGVNVSINTGAAALVWSHNLIVGVADALATKIPIRSPGPVASNTLEVVLTYVLPPLTCSASVIFFSYAGIPAVSCF
ncbi:MAG: hypothetical protein NUV75_07825 [Gallionella sp.]|nr:hypothetical protein [Gallionella sp.]